MVKTIFFIGDDKLGHRAIAALPSGTPIWLNRTMDTGRVARLVWRRSISIRDLFEMVRADLERERTRIPDLHAVMSNSDVAEVIGSQQPQRVVCFRAGLIFSRTTLASGPQFLNIHYAELPKWGGLGALPRALRAGAYDQAACLHEMLPEIDAGEVLFREPFRLDPSLTYRVNEDRAFAAGLEILKAVAGGRIPS